MADVTLGANANYSALTVANGDRILLAGHTLTLDVNPTQTGVEVNNQASGGTMVFGGLSSYTLTGWIFRPGSAQLIATIPATATITNGVFYGLASYAGTANAVDTNAGTLANCTINGAATSSGQGETIRLNSGTINGGSLIGIARGALNDNTGTINNAAIHGSATASFGIGVATNDGTINGGTITAGSFSSTYGVNTNNGTINNAVITGGSASAANGVDQNNGNIKNCTLVGGTAAAAYGVDVNTGSLVGVTITGGSAVGAFGVYILASVIDNSAAGSITDATGKAIGMCKNGTTPLIVTQGSSFKATAPTNSRIISIGDLSSTAVVANGIPVTALATVPAAAAPRFALTWNRIPDAADYVLFNANNVEIGRSAVAGTNATGVTKVNAVSQFGRTIATGTVSGSTASLALV